MSLRAMTAQMPDGTVAEEWSRGTRVFRRENGMTGLHILVLDVLFPW